MVPTSGTREVGEGGLATRHFVEKVSARSQWHAGVDGSPMTPSLARSYSSCERVARREAGNFYLAFRVLPREQRQAMCALYAFLRVADDLSDGPQPIAEKRQLVNSWRQRWYAAL